MHSAEVSDPKTFVGRDMVVVGSAQSAVLLAAFLHEVGARVRLAARADAINWNGVARQDAPLAERLLWPDSGLGTGWKAWVYSEMPRVFYRFPPHLRRRIVTNGWAPSGAWWLKDRIIGRVPLLMRHQVERAWEDGGRVRLDMRTPDGRFETSADHASRRPAIGTTLAGCRSSISRCGPPSRRMTARPC